MATAFIGTSGYSYNHWKGLFYPDELSPKDWFPFYTRHFNTVELNNSFYQLPKPESFDNWRDTAPGEFLFSVKANRYITHVKRLREPRESLDRFMKNAEHLEGKLGPVLFQLPPNFHENLPRLKHILALRQENVRWVFEFRHGSWFADDVLDVLRDAGAGFCVQDMTAGCPTIATTSFAYLRLHGGRSHGGSYQPPALREWAEQVNRWLDNDLDVFVYFNNDIGGHAVHNAQELREMVERAPVPAG